MANLNINSLRHKFDQLKYLVMNSIDILVITETKLDESFSAAHFEIDGFHSPYVFNRSLNGGGIMVFVRDDIFSKELHMHKSCFSADIEGIFIEINLRKTK